MNPTQKRVDTIAPRSAAAVELLEQLQKREGRISGDVRTPEDDSRIFREIAERQLMAERLDSVPPSSVAKIQEALVALVGEPGYAAQVENRASELERYCSQSDGDRWSRYERPDRRRRLGELVVRVEQGAAKCGHKIPRRPVVGTLPTYDVNARALPGPPGEGHLVVFDSGIFNYSTLLGKAAAQAIDAKPGEDGGSLMFDPNRIYREPDYCLALERQWADLLFSQAVLGTCSYAEVARVSQEHAPFADQFKEAIDTFILAHEYGHVILGHTDLYGTGQPVEPEIAHAQEFAADGVGFEICAAWGGSLWACLGASVFFFGSEAGDLAANVFLTGDSRGKPSPTHPSPTSRRRATMERLKEADGDALQISRYIYEALGRMTTFVLPAFAEAFRQGFPEAGYRPADEYAKAAAFEAFWRTCVALNNKEKK
jgi:hypothetical protein